MKKTIIDPDVGEGLDVFDESESIDGLVHSNGVAVHFPQYTRVFLSGMASIADTDVEAQTRNILERIQQYLSELGGDMQDIVRVRVYVNDVDDDDFLTIHEVRAEFFDKEHYPASTLIEVEDLAFDQMLVEIDADAIIPEDQWETEILESPPD